MLKHFQCCHWYYITVLYNQGYLRGILENIEPLQGEASLDPRHFEFCHLTPLVLISHGVSNVCVPYMLKNTKRVLFLVNFCKENWDYSSKTLQKYLSNFRKQRKLALEFIAIDKCLFMTRERWKDFRVKYCLFSLYIFL